MSIDMNTGHCFQGHGYGRCAEDHRKSVCMQCGAPCVHCRTPVPVSDTREAGAEAQE